MTVSIHLYPYLYSYPNLYLYYICMDACPSGYPPDGNGRFEICLFPFHMPPSIGAKCGGGGGGDSLCGRVWRCFFVVSCVVLAVCLCVWPVSLLIGDILPTVSISICISISIPTPISISHIYGCNIDLGNPISV